VGKAGRPFVQGRPGVVDRNPAAGDSGQEALDTTDKPDQRILARGVPDPQDPLRRVSKFVDPVLYQ
jgi:hypothetical protein